MQLHTLFSSQNIGTRKLTDRADIFEWTETGVDTVHTPVLAKKLRVEEGVNFD